MEPTKEDYATKSVDDPTCDVMVFFSSNKSGESDSSGKQTKRRGDKKRFVNIKAIHQT